MSVGRTKLTTSTLDYLYLFRSPYPRISPVLLAKRKWLRLGIASYMSPCNATERSLFRRSEHADTLPVRQCAVGCELSAAEGPDQCACKINPPQWYRKHGVIPLRAAARHVRYRGHAETRRITETRADFWLGGPCSGETAQQHTRVSSRCKCWKLDEYSKRIDPPPPSLCLSLPFLLLTLYGEN